MHKFLAVIIEFAKRKDGNTILRCIRNDGSTTWQRNENRQARFFPVHDLLHYAVETELGFTQGFFGLIAAGWDINETTGKSARGAVPDETIAVERLVSLFTAEWNSPNEWTAAEFNAQQTSPATRDLADEELRKVRARFDELVARWRDLPEGETLRVEFSTEGTASAPSH